MKRKRLFMDLRSRINKKKFFTVPLKIFFSPKKKKINYNSLKTYVTSVIIRLPIIRDSFKKNFLLLSIYSKIPSG